MAATNHGFIDVDPTLIAQRLRHIRQARGLSQTQVALAADLNLGNYNEIEHAKRESFQVKTLYRLCRVLDISADYLLGLMNDHAAHTETHHDA